MCVAMPGRVLSIDGDSATVDVSDNQFAINIGLVSPAVGDYVLIHAGCAVQVLPRDEAEELESLFAEVEAAGRE